MGFFFLLVFVLLAFAFFHFAKNWFVSKSDGRPFFEMMRRVNQLHGTSFPEDESGIDYILSDGGVSGSLVFDPEMKKVCYVLGDNSEPEVLDYSYFRGWELKWVERSNGQAIFYDNVCIVFSTNDIRRPLITIKCRNKNHGDTWLSRLSILFA